MTEELRRAIATAERAGPLPRCKHGKALVDGAGERLEPSCGCRMTEAHTKRMSAERLRTMRNNAMSYGLPRGSFEILFAHLDAVEAEARGRIGLLSDLVRDRMCPSDGAMMTGECVDSGRCHCSAAIVTVAKEG